GTVAEVSEEWHAGYRARLEAERLAALPPEAVVVVRVPSRVHPWPLSWAVPVEVSTRGPSVALRCAQPPGRPANTPGGREDKGTVFPCTGEAVPGRASVPGGPSRAARACSGIYGGWCDGAGAPPSLRVRPPTG